ncbi:hypothetical protein PtrM4_129840 [Pyrenophora tritici-repentis]|uniref:Uncharacterized protein n=1 Tax=Pyrenophora tritici-repentis TaxID=45151 RepID=A0A834VL42_9PLEO|nr:hypothetical protein PtrM4_129840 [Pyrenophora tritici-repentis]
MAGVKYGDVLPIYSNIPCAGIPKVLPLALREEAIRNKFWRKCVTRDVVVTRLELTRQVIDFRAIFASSDRTYGQYRNIACDRLVRIMDCIFQNVTRIEMVYDRLTLRYPGTEFRDIVTVKVDSQAVNSEIVSTCDGYKPK